MIRITSSRRARYGHAGRNVAYNRGPPRKLRALADRDVAPDPRLSPHQNVILELGAARNARKADQHATPAQCHVVPDLDQIINLRPGADHRVRPGPTVDGAIGPDLDAVFDDDPAELGHIEIAFRVQREPEPSIADANTRMNLTTTADHAIVQGHVRTDLGGRAHDHAIADHRVGADPAVRPNLRAGPDHHPGADLGTFADAGAGIDHRARMVAGPVRGRRVEGPRHQCIGAVRIGGDQQRHARRRLLSVLGRNDTGSRHTCPKLFDIALVVEKTDLRWSGSVERRDVGERHGRIGGTTDLGIAYLSELLQTERSCGREEPGIRHGVNSEAEPWEARANGR
jgi:hypothetical protein